MTADKPREIGRLWLPLHFAEQEHRTPRRNHANFCVCVLGGEVLFKTGDGEEVRLGVEARDQFARLWMEAERQAEAQAGAAP